MMLQNWFHLIVCFYAQAQKLNSLLIWLDVKYIFSGLEDDEDDEVDMDDDELDKLVSTYTLWSVNDVAAKDPP